MKRREFLRGVGAASVVGSRGAWGQQQLLPVVGLLHSGTPEGSLGDVAAFREGLARRGFVDGHNVKIEARWAADQYGRLSEYATELARNQVDVIFTLGGAVAARAAQAATTTIPIVFANGSDAVATGLVKSLSRPDANLTGVTWFNHALQAKRIELLHELLPNVRQIGVLSNPGGVTADARLPDLERAAEALKLRLVIANTAHEFDLDEAFDRFVQDRAGAVMSVAAPFFREHRKRIIALARRHRLPTIYSDRDNIREGGLIAYGNSTAEACRQSGDYVGQILRGAKPSDLPVVQASKFDLFINLKTARALNLIVPPTLLARADEVIE